MREPISGVATNEFYSRGCGMQPERKIWRGNEHIRVYYLDVLQIGEVVDHVDLAPKSCPVPHGDPTWHIMSQCRNLRLKRSSS
jgi:hypothetical protein